MAPWPRDGRALTSNEKQEVQERLTALGFDTQGTDGKIGQNTIDAVVAWQRANGLPPDGYVTLSLLERLRRG
uniref:PG_binding_1 n=1 Tax=uncultured Rhodobacter sp. TaxID=204728 RepID=A0A060BX53_9RHOB|nr:PG_binding_1 [uncultured Rhodobacter sp.]